MGKLVRVASYEVAGRYGNLSRRIREVAEGSTREDRAEIKRRYANLVEDAVNARIGAPVIRFDGNYFSYDKAYSFARPVDLKTLYCLIGDVENDIDLLE